MGYNFRYVFPFNHFNYFICFIIESFISHHFRKWIDVINERRGKKVIEEMIDDYIHCFPKMKFISWWNAAIAECKQLNKFIWDIAVAESNSRKEIHEVN